MSDYVLAGTGSRRLQTAPLAVKRAAYDATTDRVARAAKTFEDRLVIMSGMAEGYDACLAKVALAAGIRLWCAVPNRGYGAWYWGRNSLTGRNRLAEFEAILAAAWRVTYVMEDVHRTSALRLNGEHANNLRNLWMVSGGRDGFPGANEFVAWDARPGSGTAHCVEAARLAGVPVLDLSAQVAGALPLT
jgi:hypothetical protein